MLFGSDLTLWQLNEFINYQPEVETPKQINAAGIFPSVIVIRGQKDNSFRSLILNEVVHRNINTI